MPEFDKAVTCTMKNFEVLIPRVSITDLMTELTSKDNFFPKAADAFYRWCGSATYTRDVSVPLLSISSLDDLVCTDEAILWHECRLRCFQFCD